MSQLSGGESQGHGVFDMSADEARENIVFGRELLDSLPSSTVSGGGEVLHQDQSDQERQERLTIALAGHALIALGEIVIDRNRGQSK